MKDLIEAGDAPSWPLAPRGRELNQADLVELFGLMAPAMAGELEPPTTSCTGILRREYVRRKSDGLTVSMLVCERCSNALKEEAALRSGAIEGSTCGFREPDPRRLGGPFTIWPGTADVSAFGRWNRGCPRMAGGRVVKLGACGPHDMGALGLAGKLIELDPWSFHDVSAKVWKGVAKRLRKEHGAFDLVVCYLPPPEGKVAMLADLIHARGSIRSIIYAGAIAGMRCRELEVDREPGDPLEKGWTLYEYSRR